MGNEGGKEDNDRDATFRFTYLIGASRVSLRKEVMYEGTTEYFERNEYAWTRDTYSMTTTGVWRQIATATSFENIVGTFAPLLRPCETCSSNSSSRVRRS